MDTSRDLDYEEAEEKPRARIVAYCDHCGYAIYSTDEAFEIEGNGDIIHKDCWCEYAEEHIAEGGRIMADVAPAALHDHLCSICAVSRHCDESAVLYEQGGHAALHLGGRLFI